MILLTDAEIRDTIGKSGRHIIFEVDRMIAKAQLENAFRIIGEDFVEPVINFYVSDDEDKRRVVDLWQQLKREVPKC